MNAEFWDTRPELATIRDYARARRVGPWAVLGGVVARVVAAVPPCVVLPPLIGGYGSLNMFIGIVGRSGGGKGASLAAAGALLHVTGGEVVARVGVGSGEGIAHAFAHREDKDVIQNMASVIFDIPEVDTLAALGNRTGSTILAELRKVWSGEALGFQNADPTRRIPVDAHSYRAALVAGIQPQRAAALLNDDAAGTPQRFVWLPATDPDAPDLAPTPPPVLAWDIPELPSVRDDGFRLLPVCREAREEIDRHRVARLRGDGNALDAHSLFCRLKVAAALGLLNGHAEVTRDDWGLAEHVMSVSDRTRAECQDEIAQSAEQTATARAEARAAVTNAIEESTLSRAKTRIIGKLTTEWEAAKPLRSNLAKSLRPDFDDALAALTSEGLIEVREVAGQGTSGRVIRLKGWQVPPLTIREAPRTHQNAGFASFRCLTFPASSRLASTRVARWPDDQPGDDRAGRGRLPQVGARGPLPARRPLGRSRQHHRPGTRTRPRRRGDRVRHELARRGARSRLRPRLPGLARPPGADLRRGGRPRDMRREPCTRPPTAGNGI